MVLDVCVVCGVGVESCVVVYGLGGGGVCGVCVVCCVCVCVCVCVGV